MLLSSALLLAGASAAAAVDLTTLPGFLKQSSAAHWPTVKDIGVQIWNDPEVGLNETHAHGRIVKYFSGLKGWKVRSGDCNLPTAFTAEFEHRPRGFKGELPVVGVLAEYDALVGIGHACGHNHIAANAMAVSTFASEALVHYDVPGKIICVGTPDEENAAGKFKLNNAGAFDGAKVWIMAHPTSTSAMQPMNARLNYFATFLGKTHSEVVANAYEALNIVQNLTGHLPALNSSAVGIEDVGIYATNIVQSFISFGVAGSDLQTVNKTVASLLDKTYPGVNYTIFNDKDGVALNMTGPGGHSSAATKGPLVLSVATFNALKNNSAISFYLPGNLTAKELDITIDMRTRYTDDLPTLAGFIRQALGHLPNRVTQDVKYPALELTPYIPELFVSIVESPDYNLTNFPITPLAPASTDASWVQDPIIDPTTKKLLSAQRAVMHANYRLCPPDVVCPFNHEPPFKWAAATDFSYAQTEIVARAEAQVVFELLQDPSKMAQAVAITENHGH